MYNPSVRQEARYEPASVIPLKSNSSILEWLRHSGRMISRDQGEPETISIVLEEDIDISGLIDDDSYIDDDLDLGLDDEIDPEEL